MSHDRSPATPFSDAELDQALNDLTVNAGGVYLLEMSVGRPIELGHPVSRGQVLPPGSYFYAGSAQRAMRHRLRRHLRKEKPLRWHIDYLTSHPDVVVHTLRVFVGAPRECECLTIDILSRCEGFTALVPGFGSSDCRQCTSHLLVRPSMVVERSRPNLQVVVSTMEGDLEEAIEKISHSVRELTLESVVGAV